ncbi:transposase [soil metagenome]
MADFRRKTLPHQPPWSVDPAEHIFFVTVCTLDRGGEPLLSKGRQLIQSLRFYHDGGKWWLHLAVVMPDHVHLLLSFPPEMTFTETIRQWKRWTRSHLGIVWQRDFFDHRLRRDESYFEKANYILQNPVRAGVVRDWEEWPHVWFP